MMTALIHNFTRRLLFLVAPLLIIIPLFGCGGGMDGFNLPEDDSDPEQGPGLVQVSITSPALDTHYYATDDITFACNAYQQSGNIKDENIDWSSDIDGQIGTGRSFSHSSLSPGIHYISVSAISDTGNRGNDRVQILVVAERVVIKTIYVGQNPAYLEISPDGAFVYVPNYTDDTVSIIRTSDNTIVKTLDVGSGPLSVEFSPNGSYAYVNNEDGGSVSVIDTSNHTVAETISVGALPWGLAVSPDGQYFYTANSKKNNVSVVRTDTHAVIDTVADHPDHDPPDSLKIYYNDIIVSQDGQYLYVNTLLRTYISPDDPLPLPHGDGEVMVVQVSDYTIVDHIPVGDLPICLAASPDGNYIYSTIANDDSVSVIQTSDNTVSHTIAVGDTPDDIKVSPDGAYLFVVNNNDNSIIKIRTSDNVILNTLTVGNHPCGVAVTSDQNHMYVTNYHDDTVFVIDSSQF